MIGRWPHGAIELLLQQGMTRAKARSAARTHGAWLRRIRTKLVRAFGSNRLGNPSDPTSDLIYIILARKTAERAYQAAFHRLQELGDWDEIANYPPRKIALAIRGSGLEKRKARAVTLALRAIRNRFGKVDLRHARHLDDRRLFEFLTGLPEVGPKSALCVMLYTLDRDVYPVDAHNGRVASRLGVGDRFGVDLERLDHKARQRVLPSLIPSALRFDLHVGFILLGRAVCRARPLCEKCVLRSECWYYRRTNTNNDSQRDRGLGRAIGTRHMRRAPMEVRS